MKKLLMTFLAASLLIGLPLRSARADANAVATAGTNRVSTETPPAPVTAPAVPVSSPTRENDGESRNVPGAHTLIELAPFGMILGIVALSAYFKYHRHKVMNETLRAMIDKGLPLTPELIESLKSQKPGLLLARSGDRRYNDLRTGLILSCVGIGVLFVVGKVGWIIILIGVAFLICSQLLGKPNDAAGQSPKP